MTKRVGSFSESLNEKKKQAGGITPGETTDMLKMEFEEEHCRIKDEETEGQIGDCREEMIEGPDKSSFSSGQPCPVSLDSPQRFWDDHPHHLLPHFSVSSGTFEQVTPSRHSSTFNLAASPEFNDRQQHNVDSEEIPQVNTSFPISVLSSAEKEPKSQITMEKLFDLNTKMLQHIQRLEERQTLIMKDLAKIKAALIKRADDDVREELFEQQCSNSETFEAFCQKLEEDKNYRELYVNYLIHTHGSSNVGEIVRQSMKSVVTDSVLCLYNRTGKDGKKVLPPVLLKCLTRCVKSFQGEKEIEVKKRKGVTKTTPEAECIRQIEIFVSNANTRLKRMQNYLY